jgi:hypothetical protein
MHLPNAACVQSEMRKLSRQDKAKADALVRDGGASLNQVLHQLAWYDVKLLLPVGDVFGEAPTNIPLDGDKPILCLVNKR